MSSETTPGQPRVIVTTGAVGHANQVQAHHRDFPEIRADGETAAVAAAQLVNHLTRALDSALTTWRRDTIQAAIDDVRAHLKQPAS